MFFMDLVIRFAISVTIPGEMRGFMATRNDPKRLVRRAKAGDRPAFDELIDLHRERLESWVRSRMGERIRRATEVDDLLQDTYLRAFEALNRFTWRNEHSFFRWLCTIAEHLIWNASQKRAHADFKLACDPPASGVSPSRNLRRQERFDRLESSLKGLEPEEREAIRLSRFEGLKAREIAERMGVSEITVKRMLSRALAKLRSTLGDTESLHLPDRQLGEGGDES